MKNKNVEQKKTNNNTVDVLLTPELYGTILDERSGEILRLKTLQSSELGLISKEQKKLEELKEALKSIKKDIRVSKRALRKERRILRKINRSLDIETSSITDLNNDFISEEKKYINSSSFNSKVM